MDYTITVEPEESAESERVIVAGLVAHNTAQTGPTHHREFSVTVRNAEGEIYGGVCGEINWNWLFIKYLWVSDQVRGQGFGRSLMIAAEQEAVAHGCQHAYVDTFSFQAQGFYESLGYEVFGQLDDFPPGHARFFLQKRNLTTPSKG